MNERNEPTLYDVSIKVEAWTDIDEAALELWIREMLEDRQMNDGSLVISSIDASENVNEPVVQICDWCGNEALDLYDSACANCAKDREELDREMAEHDGQELIDDLDREDFGPNDIGRRAPCDGYMVA